MISTQSRSPETMMVPKPVGGTPSLSDLKPTGHLLRQILDQWSALGAVAAIALAGEAFASKVGAATFQTDVVNTIKRTADGTADPGNFGNVDQRSLVGFLGSGSFLFAVTRFSLPSGVSEAKLTELSGIWALPKLAWKENVPLNFGDHSYNLTIAPFNTVTNQNVNLASNDVPRAARVKIGEERDGVALTATHVHGDFYELTFSFSPEASARAKVHPGDVVLWGFTQKAYPHEVTHFPYKVFTSSPSPEDPDTVMVGRAKLGTPIRVLPFTGSLGYREGTCGADLIRIQVRFERDDVEVQALPRIYLGLAPGARQASVGANSVSNTVRLFWDNTPGLQGTTVTVEGSSDLRIWNPIGRVQIPQNAATSEFFTEPAGPRRFYRLSREK